MLQMAVRNCVRATLVACVVPLGLLLSCSDDGGGASDVPGGGETGASEVAADLVGPDEAGGCTPGASMGCSVDGRAVLRCLPDGVGVEATDCISESGVLGACLEGECTICAPLENFCRNGDEVWRCDETGMAPIRQQDCDGVGTGQVCERGACVRLCALADKWDSYMGCDYWGADLDNAFVPGGEEGVYDAQGQQYAIVVSNPHPEYPADIEILAWDEALDSEFSVLGEIYDESAGWLLPFPLEPLEPGGLRVYNLPARDLNHTMQARLAYHVRASIPVTAYQFNPLDNVGVFSNDASLLLPTNVLGVHYLVMTREQTFASLRGYVTVLAVRPGETQVSITVTAPTLVGDGIGHLEPGDTITRTLQTYDVLNIETDAIGADLTGSLVLASQPVAVFGGSEASNAPNTEHCGADGRCEWDADTPCVNNADCVSFNTCCADHLEQQLFPVKTWGKHYLAAKSFDRGGESDVWRILASEDGTQVVTVPEQVSIPLLNAGEWFDFRSREHFEIMATKPILVGQFLAAQDDPGPGRQPNDAGIGDPAFILTVPTEQLREDYVVLAPMHYELDYVTLVAPQGATVLFDGEPVPEEAFELFGTGQHRVARFPVADGVHRVSADQPVGVYVYGFDVYVSYGYPGGLDLKAINAGAVEGL